MHERVRSCQVKGVRDQSCFQHSFLDPLLSPWPSLPAPCFPGGSEALTLPYYSTQRTTSEQCLCALERQPTANTNALPQPLLHSTPVP